MVFETENENMGKGKDFEVRLKQSLAVLGEVVTSLRQNKTNITKIVTKIKNSEDAKVFIVL